MQTSRLLWLPRTLALGFIAFALLSGLDTFDGNAPFLDHLSGFIVHSLRAWILMFILFVFWTKPRTAGYLFLVFGIAFVVRYELYQTLSLFSASALPVFVIGLLFVAAGAAPKRARFI